MIGFVVRLLWRLIILAIGIGLALFALVIVRPYADAYLPTFLVLILFWCVFAYLVIPALIRLFRLLIKPDHIPLHATTADGWPSDPVNIVLIAHDRRHLRRVMKQAGWYAADKATLKNSLREAWALVMNRAYPAAPMSSLFLFNRPHDIGFEIPTNGKMSPRTRHHVRFWKLTEPPLLATDHEHFSFWSKKLRRFVQGERTIWIGAATEDIGPLDLRWRTGQLTHRVSHDDTKERDFLIQSLKDAGVARHVRMTRRGDAVSFRGQSWRTRYVTDGALKVIELKK